MDAVSRFRGCRCEREFGTAAASNSGRPLSAGLPGKNKPGLRPSLQIGLVFFFLAELLANVLPAVSSAQTSHPAETGSQVEGSIRGQITVIGQDKPMAGLSVM